MLVTEIVRCRSCHSAQLNTVLDLGELYVSDFILPGEPEEKAHLELVACQECSLVQLRHTVDRDRLYRNYYYRSGMNESMVAALKDVVADAMRRVHLIVDDKVLDIGANDGTLLSLYPSNVSKYGYEPAWNLWAEAKKKSKGVIYPTYFPRNAVPHDQFKVITSIAQFYNSNNPDEYVAAIKNALGRDGIWILQMQDLDSMLRLRGFDNVCAEHLTYWSIPALLHLLHRHELGMESTSINTTNGGSIRCIIKHRPLKDGEWTYQKDGNWTRALMEFRNSVDYLRADTMALLRRLKADGKTVFGIAASTKFNTTAQYYGITPDLLPAIADRNPEKVGRMTVGSHIPIISEKELYDRKPDYLLACAWQFFEPFRVRYSALEEAGAKWIVPLPELRIVSGGESLCQPLTAAHSGNALGVTSCTTP